MGWVFLIICLIALVSVLSWGVITMGIGGQYNSKWSNKIMRYRVVIQAIALLVFVLLLALSSNNKKIFMVTLNKIYTRSGDKGETSLVGGQRVSKHSLRPDAFGEVDELNSLIGLVRIYSKTSKIIDKILIRIQNELFDLGADLATPELHNDQKLNLRITLNQVSRIEKEIDLLNNNLQSLDSFVLPGGSELASWLHLSRTVARRAERKITKLASEEAINVEILHYINRLSDLLFVMARFANNKGKLDILWQPGKTT